MSTPSGSFSIGPDNAALTVRTGKSGAMAKAGHDLEIRVDAWSAQLELGDAPSLTLDADSTSLTVVNGTGGPKALSDGDKVKIKGTINDKILKGQPITFRSSTVSDAGDGAVAVAGTLTLVGASGPVSFTLTIDDQSAYTASADVVQTAFGIEPHSAMMGALKVADTLVIEVAGTLPA